MADVNSPRIWRFLKRVAWFLKSVTVIFVYRKSLNRSPRLVTEAWLLFEARLILVHPHYSRQHVSPDNRVFCSMESTQTFRNQIHQFSQLLKPGLYLTTSCVCWSTTTSHPLVGRRHTLLTCSRLQQTFRHWLQCAPPWMATTLFDAPTVDMATGLFQSLLLELGIGCRLTWRPHRAQPKCSNANWKHFCLTVSTVTDNIIVVPYVRGTLQKLVDIWHLRPGFY